MGRTEHRQYRSLYLLTAALAIAFSLIGALFPKKMSSAMQVVLDVISSNFGWLYLLAMLGFVVFCLVIAFSRFGKVKLGALEDKPEYSTMSWFAMLFSAGMGIGLVFWSVGEPLSHFSNPPYGKAFSNEAVETALQYTFFHWGIHPWAAYSIVGLALAYFGFRNRMPLLISSAFFPVLGDRIYRWPGKVFDGLAVFATVFGVATSLGLGTMQINSGLNYLFGITNSVWVSSWIIVVITFLFTLSAITGISRGIKILSNTNLIIALLLFIFMLAVGPTRFIINITTSSIGQYLQNFLSMSLYTDPVNESGWVSGWTVFYWAWWIAWAPFVGGFIARISRGRTIREFILGVLIAPVIVSFLWMGTFGGASLHLQAIAGQDIVGTVTKDIASGLFVVFHHYPLANVLSGLALILIAVFFITSADSATFVVGMLVSGGSLEPKIKTKIFWGVMQGGIAIVLLLTGGLTALQTASIVAAFPFMFVMIFMAYSLLKELRQEKSEV